LLSRSPDTAGSPGATDVVSASGLDVRVGRHVVIHDLDLRLRGGVLGLLGPNGAGKTTLIRALATALPVAGGELRLFGVDVRRPGGRLREVRSRIGYAPQSPLVLRHLSVAEQVEYAGWLKGLDATASSRRRQTVLEQVRLTDRAATRTGSLSGGMLRRLGIAMALVAEPDLLLLDEPTAGLDPEQRVAFRNMVTELGRSATVVLSTHLIEDVVSVCPAVVVLAGGRTVFSGTPEALAAKATRISDGRTPVEAGFSAVTGATA
jgi:ABC-type multidrug transport system ATPase subunit